MCLIVATFGKHVYHKTFYNIKYTFIYILKKQKLTLF